MLCSLVFALVAAQSGGRCCWSKFGDKSTCGGYPSGGSGGKCSTDWTKTCSGNNDCPASPTPTPGPSPPGPGPSPPAPSPYPPHKPSPPLPPVPARGARGTELLGYIENWVNVKWWDNNIPGHCLMGCMEPGPFMESIAPYSAINYGFAALNYGNPAQVGCGSKSPAGPCPVWDGENIYLAKAGMQGSHLVDGTIDLETSSPGGIAISEVVRMARQHPSGPKRAKITLGGWSDYARLATVENAQKAAKLMAKAVLITFADGVDLDFEHLTPYSKMPGDSEFEAFVALITTLRTELDALKPKWAASAQVRSAALQKTFNGLEKWQKADVKPWYATQFAYLKEVAANKPPHLEISWTTRFNAWVPKGNPYNYAYDPLPSWALNSTFETDNEGTKFFSNVSDLVDTVNIMAYDATGLKFDYETILYNYATLGNLDLRKVNMGFEPGEQAASGVWEGLEKDKNVTQYVKEHNIGGAMIWAANPSPKTNPTGASLCPEVAKALNAILEPTYAWGPPPNYTKIEALTGYLPAAEVARVLEALAPADMVLV